MFIIHEHAKNLIYFLIDKVIWKLINATMSKKILCVEEAVFRFLHQEFIVIPKHWEVKHKCLCLCKEMIFRLGKSILK